jgi:hypothetical protein
MPAPIKMPRTSSKSRWGRLAFGLLRSAASFTFSLGMAILILALWAYLRAFACWADLDDWTLYLCQYDFLLIVLVFLFCLFALYAAVRKINSDERVRRVWPTTAIVIAGCLIAIVLGIATSPIAFPMLH